MAIIKNGTTYEVTGTYATESSFYADLATAGATVDTYGNTPHSTFYNVDFDNDTIQFQNACDVEFPFIRSVWTFRGSDSTQRLRFENGCRVHFTSPQTKNGFSYATNGGEIRFAFTGDIVNWNNQTLYSANGCDVLLEGIAFRGEFATWIRGNITLRDCIVEKEGNTGDIQFNISDGNQTVLENVTMYADGQSGITFRGGTPTLTNVKIFGARDSFNNEANNLRIVVDGLDSDTGAVADIAQFSQGGTSTLVRNAKNGARFVTASHLNGGNPQFFGGPNQIDVTQVIKGTATIAGSSTAPSDFKIVIPANVSAGNSAITSIFDGLTTDTPRLNLINGNVDGTLPETEILTAVNTSGTQGQPNNGDIVTMNDAAIVVDATIASPILAVDHKAQDQAINNRSWYAIGYEYNIVTGVAYMGGQDGTDVSPVFSVDLSITESDKAITDAYTELDGTDLLNIAQKRYDAFKSLLVDTYSGQTETWLTRSGDLINTPYRVVVDPTFTLVREVTKISALGITPTGTVDITTGTVTGTGTTFTDLVVGMFIRINGISYTIQSITNDTELIIEEVLEGTLTGQSYSIEELELRIKSSQSGNITSLREVVLQNGATETGTIIDSTADSALVFSGVDSWIVYASATDQDANTNALGSGLGSENYRFNYVASTTYYLRLTTGTDTLLKTITPTLEGETEVSLTTAGLLTALPAQITQAVWDQGTAGHTDVGTFGYLLQDTDTKINQLELVVFVDTEAVTNGAGTQESPFDNFDDAKTLADTLGAKTIIVSGDATVNVNLKNFIIKGGSSRATFNINNQNIDGSRFQDIELTGTASEPNNPKGFKAYNCVIDGVTGLQGEFINCLIKGTLTPADNAIINIDDCNSGEAGLDRPTISLATLTDVKMAVRKYSGGLTVSGSTDANNEMTVSTVEGKLTVDATNTAGVISIRGVSQLTDDSAGATIDTTGLLETVDVNADLDEILADTNELQTNQGDWATATGFATHTNVTDSETAIISELDQIKENQDNINNGVQKSSLVIPHTTENPYPSDLDPNVS